MEITVGDFNPETKTVPVTFQVGDIIHERTVNACLDEAGNYDPGATEERIGEVARGVAHKIEVGAITAAPPPSPAETGE